jgi:SAM-dependent methyltransferase
MSEYRELLAGCGKRREKIISTPNHKGWENLTTLDWNEAHEPEIIYDLTGVRWPFDDNYFDELHLYDVIEHCTGGAGDTMRFFSFFREAHRILKPNGFICATTPLEDTEAAWGDPGHGRIINEMSLTFLCQRAYEEQVGKTPMSDYRHIYKVDFEPVWMERRAGSFCFVLQAKKNPRLTNRSIRVSS